MDKGAILDDLIAMTRVNELLGRKEEKTKPYHIVLWVLAVIGAVAAVAGIAYLVYRYLSPAYEEDFYDFDDDFDDFEDDLEEMKEDIKEIKEGIKDNSDEAQGAD